MPLDSNGVHCSRQLVVQDFLQLAAALVLVAVVVGMPCPRPTNCNTMIPYTVQVHPNLLINNGSHPNSMPAMNFDCNDWNARRKTMRPVDRRRRHPCGSEGMLVPVVQFDDPTIHNVEIANVGFDYTTSKPNNTLTVRLGVVWYCYDYSYEYVNQRLLPIHVPRHP